MHNILYGFAGLKFGRPSNGRCLLSYLGGVHKTCAGEPQLARGDWVEAQRAGRRLAQLVAAVGHLRARAAVSTRMTHILTGRISSPYQSMQHVKSRLLTKSAGFWMHMAGMTKVNERSVHIKRRVQGNGRV